MDTSYMSFCGLEIYTVKHGSFENYYICKQNQVNCISTFPYLSFARFFLFRLNTQLCSNASAKLKDIEKCKQINCISKY